LAGDDGIVFIDSWPLISIKILLATNQISRIFTHGNPVDFTKGSPNGSNGELIAGEDDVPVAHLSLPALVAAVGALTFLFLLL
jgi:hypothetical protein